MAQLAVLKDSAGGRSGLIQKRIARSGATSVPEQSRLSTRKVWNEEIMERAVKDVTEGTLSVRRAALEYSVPRSTLHDRISGKVCAGAVSGASRYLDNEEEDELVEFLLGCAEVGYPKTVKEVRAIVGKIVADKHALNETSTHPVAAVSHGWWERFQHRNKEVLSLRTAESLSLRRAAAMSPMVLNKYFDLLEDTMKENDLNHRPCLVFNCDESGFPLSHRPGKRVAGKGQRRVQMVSSDSKAHITVLACANASGYAIPPMVIYARASLSQQLTKGEIAGTMYGLSPGSGWIDGGLFLEWFERHFLLYAPAGRPLLLLLDGHSSHFNPQFIRTAAKNGVIVFALPPNTTHVAQPLDSICFRALKQAWDEQCDHYMSTNIGKVVTVYQFSELFAAAWKMAMTPQNVISSFQHTGVYPVNRAAIEILGKKQSPQKLLPMASLAKNNGISYLPLYSPLASKQCTQKPVHLDFTNDEFRKFKIRYEENYDVPGDTRYDEWVRAHHSSEGNLSECNSSSSSVQLDTPHQLSTIPTEKSTKGKLSSFLKVPTPIAAKKTTVTRGARVLTSEDHLTEIEEKERLKKEKEELKEQRKKAREIKAKEKAAKAGATKKHA